MRLVDTIRQGNDLIGALELAQKLQCHPNSIARFLRLKPDFPRPRKIFGKNLWSESVIDEYIADIVATAQGNANALVGGKTARRRKAGAGR
jgi:predicted DNA-binding transcriptional regulator AlpA